MNTQQQKQQTRKVLTGLLIGVVGAGALYCMHTTKQRKTPMLQRIGRSIANVGEIIENCNLNCVTEAAENIEQRLPRGADVLNNLSDWISTGLSLWKTMNR